MTAQVEDVQGIVAITRAASTGDALTDLEAIMAGEDVAALEAAFAAADAPPRTSRVASDARRAGRDAHVRDVEFPTYVRSHQRRVRAQLRAYLRRASDIDDAVQEVFAEMWMRWDARATPEERGSLLFLVTRNSAINMVRSKYHRQSRMTEFGRDLDELMSSSHGPEELCVRAERIAKVRAALRTLPPDQRALILARHYDGVPFLQLAAAGGTTSTALRSKEQRILKKLRRELAKAGLPSVTPLAGPPSLWRRMQRPSLWRRMQQVVSDLPATAQATILGIVLTSLTAAPPAAVGAPLRGSRPPGHLTVPEWVRPRTTRTSSGSESGTSSSASSTPTTTTDILPPVRSAAGSMHRLLLPSPSVPPVVETCDRSAPGDKITVTVPVAGVSKCVSESWVPVCELLPDASPAASCQTEGEPSYFVTIPPPGM